MSAPRCTDRAALVALRLRYLDGEPLAELAAEAGCTTNRLRGRWTEQGVTAEYPRPDHRMRGWTMPQLRELHRRWCAGESCMSLAAECGVPHRTLTNAMARAGLSLDRPAGLPHMGGDRDEAARRATARSVVLAADLRARGWLWERIRGECERRYGYRYTARSLSRSTRQWCARVKRGER